MTSYFAKSMQEQSETLILSRLWPRNGLIAIETPGCKELPDKNTVEEEDCSIIHRTLKGTQIMCTAMDIETGQPVGQIIPTAQAILETFRTRALPQLQSIIEERDAALQALSDLEHERESLLARARVLAGQIRELAKLHPQPESARQGMIEAGQDESRTLGALRHLETALLAPARNRVSQLQNHLGNAFRVSIDGLWPQYQGELRAILDLADGLCSSWDRAHGAFVSEVGLADVVPARLRPLDHPVISRRLGRGPP